MDTKIKNVPELNAAVGELTPHSNLPHGKQLFLTDENHKDVGVLFNWEKDPLKHEQQHEENLKLARIFNKAYKQSKEEQVTPYRMAISNAATFIRSGKNKKAIETGEAVTAFTVSVGIAAAFCMSVEDVISDLINYKS